MTVTTPTATADAGSDTTRDSARAPLAPRGLAVAAALGLLWPTWAGVQQLQVGRVLALGLLGLVLFDLITSRMRPRRAWWAAALLGGGFAALTAWTTLSSATWGCFCGSTQAMGDTAIILGLACVIMLYADAKETTLVLAAAVASVVLAGLLAVGGVYSLHANVLDLTQPRSGRLEGAYGNPNSMGMAFALALPISGVLAWRLRGLRRLAGVAAFVALGGLLLLTFSRGSLLAAGFGVAAAALIAIPALRTRRAAIATAAIVPALIVAVILSPFYRDQRVSADFGDRAAPTNNRDHSGWLEEHLGEIEEGAVLSNVAGSESLVVTTTGDHQGVTYPFDLAFERGTWDWELRLSAPGAPRARLEWMVARYDGTIPARGQVSVGGSLAPRIQRFTIDARERDYFVLSIWSDRGTAFRIDGLTTHGQGPVPERPKVVGTKLLGKGSDALHAREGEFVDSRRVGLDLAWKAFKEQPLRGLGNDRFPDYALDHADYGRLPTHNTYAQVAAELGIVGLLLFGLTGAGVLLAAVRSRAPTIIRAMATGAVVVGAVNLLFINALAAPSMTLPLLLAAAALTGWAGPRPGRAGDQGPNDEEGVLGAAAPGDAEVGASGAGDETPGAPAGSDA